MGGGGGPKKRGPPSVVSEMRVIVFFVLVYAELPIFKEIAQCFICLRLQEGPLHRECVRTIKGLYVRRTPHPVIVV